MQSTIKVPFTLAGNALVFAKNFAKEWVESPIASASIAVAKKLIFCNATANAQCERTLKHSVTT